MPRTARAVKAGGVYHVLNRGNGRAQIFHKDADYAAFERILAEGLARAGDVRLYCYCLMPNHWHLLLRPASDEAIGRLLAWVGVTHVRRYHAHYHSEGGGHLYQGRYKAFPVQRDDVHFRAVCRYIEANPLRAGLVRRAEDWPWCSLRRRLEAASRAGSTGVKAAGRHAEQRGHHSNSGRLVGGTGDGVRVGPPLAPWPADVPRDWVARVNEPMPGEVLGCVREAVVRGRPFGDERWTARTAVRLGLEFTLRPRGRPRRAEKE